MPSIDDIAADFDLLDDWEDRYRYVIELGRGLPPFPDDERTEDNRVRGCASQVWLSARMENVDGGRVMRLRGDSDAHIVRGLVAIVLAMFDGRAPEEIAATDAEAMFSRLKLREHLTAQRSSGLHALVNRIKAEGAGASA